MLWVLIWIASTIVIAIQMSTHNICLHKKVDKKYTGCNLKTTELLDCALIGVCAVIRSNRVFTLSIETPWQLYTILVLKFKQVHLDTSFVLLDVWQTVFCSIWPGSTLFAQNCLFQHGVITVSIKGTALWTYLLGAASICDSVAW